MVNLTTHKLRLVTKNRGIKNNKNMSRERLLSTLDELERNFKTLSEKGLERITKMQNITKNELDQITRMQNLSRDELKKIARMRRIESYENMSKEGLLIALLRSEQSRAELYDKVKEIKAEENRIKTSEEYPDHYDPDYEGVWNIKDLFHEIN